MRDARPLGGWDYKEKSMIVWASKLDEDKYLVEVVRDPDDMNKAFLRLFEDKNNPKLLLEERVGLSYGAAFGPDVADVHDWQERIIKFVDAKGEAT